MAVDSRLVGLVHSARADILSTQIHGRADLMLQSKAPLHVIRRAQLAIRTAVMAIGWRQVFGFESGDAQEGWPCAKPEMKLWLAAIVALTALFGTPGAIADPPTLPSRPP